MKKTLKNKKGFTLIELMVVVAIMGVLVAVAIPVFNNVTNKAQVNACVTTQRTIESAIQMAKANGDTVTLPTGTTATPIAAELWKELVPKYIAETPKCPTDKAGTGTYSITADGIVSCSGTSGKLAHTKAVATDPDNK